PAVFARSSWVADVVILAVSLAAFPEVVRLHGGPLPWIAGSMVLGLGAGFFNPSAAALLPLLAAGLYATGTRSPGYREWLFPLYVFGGLGALRLSARQHPAGGG
ncbi:MAG: hypothetical protein C4320_04940, partial [Armatimonadota bacterium]